MSSRALVRLIPAAGAAAALCAGAALAGPELVEFPEGYQERFTHYTTRNRPDERMQVIKAYANDVAVQSAADGPPLDSGSVVVMEVYKAELDDQEEPVVGEDGFFVPDELVFLAVMESRDGWGDEYPEEIRNGTWEYAAFDLETHELIERDYTGCFECHKPQDEADYLFTLDELQQEGGG